MKTEIAERDCAQIGRHPDPTPSPVTRTGRPVDGNGASEVPRPVLQQPFDAGVFLRLGEAISVQRRCRIRWQGLLERRLSRAQPGHSIPGHPYR